MWGSGNVFKKSKTGRLRCVKYAHWLLSEYPETNAGLRMKLIYLKANPNIQG